MARRSTKRKIVDDFTNTDVNNNTDPGFKVPAPVGELPVNVGRQGNDPEDLVQVNENVSLSALSDLENFCWDPVEEDERNESANTTSLTCQFATPSRILTSTPVTNKKRNFERKVSSGPIVRCDRCKRPYKTAVGLQNHLRMHVWEDNVARAQCENSVRAHALEVSTGVLDEMKQDINVGVWPQFNRLIDELKLRSATDVNWQIFVDLICKILQKYICAKKVVFVSAVRYGVLVGVNKELADSEFRLMLREKLVPSFGSVIDTFLPEFTMKIGEKVITMIAMTVRGSDVPAAVQNSRLCRSQDDFQRLEGKQIVFHCAGACCRGFLRTGQRFPGNRSWRNIVTCLKGNFIETELGSVVPVPPEIKAWTISVSRGGYLLVGLHAFEFFLTLASLICGCELPDGSLSHSHVQSLCISNEEVVRKWDTTVGSSMSEADSLLFMSKIIRSFTNVIGSGIVFRRMNDRMKKNISVPFRKSIAR